MPVVSRLDWICKQLEMGRKGHLTLGQARDTGKLKVKVILQPANAGAIDAAVSHGLTTLLSFVRIMLVEHVAMDRGHKHSNGTTEICFWINISHGDGARQLPDGPPQVPARDSGDIVHLDMNEPIEQEEQQFPGRDLCGERVAMETEDSDSNFSNAVWRLREGVQKARAQGDHASRCFKELADIIFCRFQEQLRARAGIRRSGQELTWTEVRATNLEQDLIYMRCCEAFFGGTRDPRSKPLEFLRAVHAVQMMQRND